MSPRPSNHLSSALTPDILDTILQAENRDHQDEHHKYIGRTANNTLDNTLEEHEKYIRKYIGRTTNNTLENTLEEHEKYIKRV